MINYRAAVADYLATRRAMGYKLAYQGQMSPNSPSTWTPSGPSI